MKIKTITCHHVYNYGATIQAFALQDYLEHQGHEVEIIDYRLPKHRGYEFFALFPDGGRAYPYLKRVPFMRYIYYPIKRRHLLHTWARKRAFDRFDRDYLHISKETYRTTEEIQAASPKADIYIAGSDQIWNTEFDNGTTPAYYLDFGNPNTPRISYAASFGTSKIAEGREDFIRENLKRFDAISVREATGLSILESLGINGVQVVDPVFLLSKEEWKSRLSLEEGQRDYIFLYDFVRTEPSIRDFALNLSKRTGLELISINEKSDNPYAHRQVNNAGPKEFLQWLLNARYVVSNSFHATAFSLIFEREFFTFPLVSQRNPSRMTDLLRSIGLMDRFKPVATSGLTTIDWNAVKVGLQADINRSKEFLRKNCK